MEPFCTLNTLDSGTTWATSTTWTESSISPGSLLWKPGGLFEDKNQQGLRQQQQAEWQPASSIRADATPARFSMLQASIVRNANGVVAIGIGDKPARRNNRAAFEADKAAENFEKLQLMQQPVAKQQPQRFAAATEHRELLLQRQAQEEQEEEQRKLDALAASMNHSPEHMTSHDNMLSDGLTLPRSRPASRCTTRTEPNTARSCCSSRPASPEVAARAQQALKGHLLPGALLVEEEEEDEEQQQAKEMQAALMTAAKAAYEEAVKKEEELIALYPHGAPKRVIREYRAQGVELPGLGYACALASPRGRP